MNTLEHLRSNIKRILTHNKLTKDVRIHDEHLEYLVAMYRANWIREYFRPTMDNTDIDRQWLQHFNKLTVTKTNTFEDDSFCCGEISIGKLKLPQLVNMYDDTGLYRIASYSNTKVYGKCTIDEFMKRLDPDIVNRGTPHICARVGLMLYIYPYTKEIKADLILDDPMDGICFEDVYLQTFELEVKTTYKVFEAPIIHNGITVLPGATFVAVNNTFSGNGKVKRLDEAALMRLRDMYPLSMEMVPKITLEICTKEYGIERQMISDTKNNYKDESQPQP